MRFVDLHTHLLPDLDDGPATLEETIGMLRMAHARGTRTIVATPHMFAPHFGSTDVGKVRAVFAGSMSRLEEKARAPETSFLHELSILLGAENFLSPELLQRVATGDVLTLNESRYLLVEWSPYTSYQTAERGLERILASGFFPVLAHVERYPVLQQQPSRLRDLVKKGCIAQINGSSLLNPPSRKLARANFIWLRQGVVQLIASDAHGTGRRNPDLERVRSSLENRFSEPQLRTWLCDNPQRILDNGSLTSPHYS
jgi:protein-tyrosine phosphatase